MHPPRRRQLLPLSAEEQARRDQEIEDWRAERARRDAEMRPARLAALQTGPALRDLESAADCGCSCHPRAADVDLHGGGVSCPCQLTPQERDQVWKDLFEELDALGPDPGRQAAEEELAEQARALGVTARWAVTAAPFVITGHVDGRGFYLRERHGDYRVTVATDEDPTADPWTLPAERPTADIAEGTEEDLTDADGGCDPARALTVAVDAVRTFLSRRQCAHEQPRDERHLFCSLCGIRLADADAWSG